MAQFNPAVSEYIAKSEPFAQPILIELRAIVHSFCPTVKETIKWSFPNFEYNGSILCSMAAFRQHCSFGFWLASLMTDEHGVMQKGGMMGDLGKVRSLEDVPSPDKLGPLILQAMALIDSGAKLPKKSAAQKGELELHPELVEALAQNPKAKDTFDNFSYSHRREYAEWISDAKTEATRQRRLDKTIENLLEGKSKEWKYKK